jgi:hypothetical protein
MSGYPNSTGRYPNRDRAATGLEGWFRPERMMEFL